MLPRDLKAGEFAQYPPQAQALAVAHLSALQQLPLTFLPSLLRELVDYDYKFPAERVAIDRELGDLSALLPAQLTEWFHAFAQCSLSPALEHLDWVNQPSQFVEQLSAYLWSTNQLETFRNAALTYGERLAALHPPQAMPAQRLGIAVIGQGVASYDGPLFHNLLAHGVSFSKVKPENGLQQLLSAVAERAQSHPAPYGHWYIDGGELHTSDDAQQVLLTRVSYGALKPVRTALLQNIQGELQRVGMGPEELRTHLARLRPADIGMDSTGDPVLERFQLKLLTEGSGTQIFSTTFAQWAAREALRRAQPLTLLVRFAPRQRQRPMNELLSGGQESVELDAPGSLIDADMAAWYQWLNQQRLPGSEQSAFVAWFEGHSQAIAIGPSLPRGTRSDSSLDLAALLRLATS